MQSQIKHVISAKLIPSVIHNNQLLEAVVFYRQCGKNLAPNQTEGKKVTQSAPEVWQPWWESLIRWHSVESRAVIGRVWVKCKVMVTVENSHVFLCSPENEQKVDGNCVFGGFNTWICFSLVLIRLSASIIQYLTLHNQVLKKEKVDILFLKQRRARPRALLCRAKMLWTLTRSPVDRRALNCLATCVNSPSCGRQGG